LVKVVRLLGGFLVFSSNWPPKSYFGEATRNALKLLC
jgi:hypothetical protein